jgi:hypothetical protein
MSILARKIGSVPTRRMLRYAPRFHRIFFFFKSPKQISQKTISKKTNFRTISVKFFFNFFLAIMVLRLIWSMLSKIWGGGSRPAGLGGDEERTNST